jgi:hypothetical protein
MRAGDESKHTLGTGSEVLKDGTLVCDGPLIPQSDDVCTGSDIPGLDRDIGVLGRFSTAGSVLRGENGESWLSESCSRYKVITHLAAFRSNAFARYRVVWRWDPRTGQSQAWFDHRESS